MEGSRFPFIVMERCAESLKRRKPTEARRASAEELDAFLAFICPVLDHIHRHGIIHRDLKPENILIRADSSFALADFGIAWFDSTLFSGERVTEANNRMGNFMFMAPEQMDSKAPPTPATDIYAVGQILYWLATDDVIRGTGHKRLAAFDASLGRFDSIVERCVRQDPKSRFQSGKEILDALTGDARARAEYADDQMMLDRLQGFERLLAQVAPGKYGVVELADPGGIHRLMMQLAASLPLKLWWTRGLSNDGIRRIFQEERYWVLNSFELDIDRAWVARRFHSIDHCFVLLRSKRMPPFPIGTPSPDAELHYAGLYKGRYISPDEAEDGFATIDGQVVALDGTQEIRERPIRPYFLFIATNRNPVLLPLRYGDADHHITEFIKLHEQSAVEVTQEELQAFFRLPRHPRSEMHD